MHNQPKYRPLRSVDQIGTINDGRSARPVVEGSVARDGLKEDVEFYTGKLKDQSKVNATRQLAPTTRPQRDGVSVGQTTPQTYQGFVTEIPMEITATDLDRGQERFNIYCAVCHGRTGDGLGMIVRRGFRRPPSYHEERLRQAPVGYFFDVITIGYGTMPDYASQITPADRWRIIAYVRALQLSQHATLDDVPPDKRDQLKRRDAGAASEKQGEHNR